MSEKNWEGLENTVRDSWLQYARENYPSKSGFIPQEKIERYARYLFAQSTTQAPSIESVR